jgi:stearoyl-CoA desaturase (delta-9 desaturase)
MSPQMLEAPARKHRRPKAALHHSKAPADTAEAPLYDIYDPRHFNIKSVDWVVLGWMVMIHVGALAAPFFFTWQAFVGMLVMHWATCSIGICLGYHRFLSHKSLKLRQPARFLVAMCGVLSGEGSPLMWAATHRVHHARSDDHGDPHTPNHGSWWSHIIWLFMNHDKKCREQLYRRYTPDLLKDRMLLFFEKTYGPMLFASGIALYALGGWPWLLWGLCFRMCFAYHSTWFVNSATHIWGYRNYDTDDRSRNLWWVALLSYGEGWHNNHHAHPRLARAGHKWWEIDMTFYAIRALQFVGLAYEVDDRKPVGRAAAPADAAA